MPVWAGNLEKLPDVPIIEISGKKHKDMAAVNLIAADTIKDLYAKMDRIKQVEFGGPHDDDGITAADVAAAAGLTPPAERPRA